MKKRHELSDLARRVRCESVYGAVAAGRIDDDWKKRAHNYRVTLTYRRRRLTVDWFQGELNTRDPEAAGVLDCLLSDASSGDLDFAAFCSELGYNEDSRKAERTWRACQQIGRDLRRLLGDDFDRFMEADR